MLLALALFLHMPHPLPAAPEHLGTTLDTLVDAGGYRMHLVVHRGTEPLTIVMESGGGASAESWSGVDTLLARRTGATVVVYDRAGFGGSGVGPADLTPRQQVRQLDQILTQLVTPAARLLVGHSYGGLLAVLHAHMFAGKVRGLVLVDPMNPRFVRATGDFLDSTVPHIEDPATAKDSAVARLVSTFDQLAADPEASDSGLAIPVVIVTAGDAWWGKPDIDRAWRASHAAIAQAGPRRRLVVAEGSKHDVPATRPDTILDAVLAVASQR